MYGSRISRSAPEWHHRLGQCVASGEHGTHHENPLHLRHSWRVGVFPGVKVLKSGAALWRTVQAPPFLTFLFLRLGFWNFWRAEEMGSTLRFQSFKLIRSLLLGELRHDVAHGVHHLSLVNRTLKQFASCMSINSGLKEDYCTGCFICRASL